MKKVVLLGAGGHARVIIDILKRQQDIEVIGTTDKTITADKSLIPIIGTDDVLEEIFREGKANYAIIAVGSTGDNTLRQKLYEKIKDIGYKALNAIHFKSIIAESVTMGEGNVFMAGSIINPDVKIGNNNIINTGSIIEHDVKMGDHIHISPGAVLAGGVRVGDLSHIGLGARVIEGVTIGKNCLIGAGAVVLDDIPDNSVVVGIPGRIIRKRGEDRD